MDASGSRSLQRRALASLAKRSGGKKPSLAKTALPPWAQPMDTHRPTIPAQADEKESPEMAEKMMNRCALSTSSIKIYPTPLAHMAITAANSLLC